MRISLYRQWLADSKQKPEYIDKLVNQVTVNSEKTCLGWAVKHEFCPPEATLLDLSVSALHELITQAEDLPNNLRTYLRTCLQFTAEQDFPIAAPPGTLSFPLLVGELQQICPSEIAEPLMRALLLSPRFCFSSLKRWELNPDSDKYTVCRAVILENLTRRRDRVIEMLVQTVHPLLEEADPSVTYSHTLLPDLRTGYVKLSSRLKKKVAQSYGFAGSAEENLLLRMDGWQFNYSTGSKADDISVDWYHALGEDCMEKHMADTFLSMIELALQHSGCAFSPLLPITQLNDTDKCYYSLLAPFERLLTPKLAKSAQIATAQIARMLRLGVCYIDRLPKHGTSRLRLAPAALQTLSQEPSRSPDTVRYLDRVWQDPTLVHILLHLLTELEQAPDAVSHILEKGAELIGLLSSAPHHSDDEGNTSASALVNALTSLLDGSLNLPALQDSTKQDLRMVIKSLQSRQNSAEAIQKLTNLLVRCHWDILQKSPGADSAASAQRLIDLYRVRPHAVTAALAPVWGKSKTCPGDWNFRSQIISGESLLLSELYGRSASDCLALAENESLPIAQRLSWANRARSDAHTAAQMAVRFEESLRTFDAQLLQARALTVLTVLSAQTDSAAEELLSDSIIPCAQCMLSCYELLDTTLPAQKASLSGSAQQAFEDHCLTRRFTFVRERSALHDRLFSSLVTDVLQKDTDLWQSIPQHFATAEDWRRLAELKLHVPADDAGTPNGPKAPTLWIRAEQPAKVFLPYYCSYLDSEITKRKQYQPGRIEAYLLKTILSMENLVLTVNQAMDNAIIRSLAYQPGFRHLLRTGHIKVSFFGPYYSLRQFAASRLTNPAFIWSSLPHEFNLDMPARQSAARYLLEQCSARDLPLKYRTLIIRLREELTLLDENLPARSKLQSYQYPNSGRGGTSLAQKLDQFYRPRQGDPMLAELCRLHFLLLSPRADEQSRQALTRSLYQNCLDGLKHNDLRPIEQMRDLCDPALYQAGSTQRKILESYTDPGKKEILDLMQTVLSSCHNEMLGALCSEHQHHIYSEAERLILPYNETTPINQGGCRLFQDTITTTETGIRFGWDQAPDFLERSQSIVRQMPHISPDLLAGKLAGNELDYTISADGGALWLARGTVHTSQHENLLVELRPHTGTIHLQTEGV